MKTPEQIAKLLSEDIRNNNGLLFEADDLKVPPRPSWVPGYEQSGKEIEGMWKDDPSKLPEHPSHEFDKHKTSSSTGYWHSLTRKFVGDLSTLLNRHASVGNVPGLSSHSQDAGVKIIRQTAKEFIHGLELNNIDTDAARNLMYQLRNIKYECSNIINSPEAAERKALLKPETLSELSELAKVAEILMKELNELVNYDRTTSQPGQRHGPMRVPGVNVPR